MVHPLPPTAAQRFLLIQQAGHAGLVAASAVSLASPQAGKLAHFAAAPLPNGPAALGYVGIPGAARWDMLLIQQAGHTGQLLAFQELQGGASQRSDAPPGPPLILSSGEVNSPCGKVCFATA